MQLKLPKLNETRLVARILTDPDLKMLSNNKSVVNLFVGWDDGYYNQNDEYVAKPQSMNAVIWHNADKIFPKLYKGAPVLICGKITVNNYESNGKKCQKVELAVETIQCLEKKEPAPGF